MILTCALLHERGILYLDLLANTLVYSAFYKLEIQSNA